jgi:hypothetical protein
MNPLSACGIAHPDALGRLKQDILRVTQQREVRASEAFFFVFLFFSLTLVLVFMGFPNTCVVPRV